MDQPVLHNIYDEHKQPVNAVACHSTMRQFVSGCADGQVMVWSSRKHLRAFHFTGHQVGVYIQGCVVHVVCTFRGVRAVFTWGVHSVCTWCLRLMYTHA